MRAVGKKLIGAQASAAIWAGVDEWLRRNPRKSVSDFVLEASIEKLEREKIPFDKNAALFDGRRRVPAAITTYPDIRPNFHVMNEKPRINSSATGAAGRLLKKGAASVVKPAAP